MKFAVQVLGLLIDILVLLEIDSNEQEIARIKTRIDALHVYERAHQQARSSQNQHGKCYLRDDKHAAEIESSAMLRNIWKSRSVLLQRGRQVQARAAKCRR